MLDGATPRLIDEWQVEPAIWNHVRRAVDDRAAPGQFILTGSAVPADDVTRHAGAGRLTRLRMRPMTLYECGVGTGRISLAALLAGEPARSADAGVTVAQLAQEIAVGGWPGLRGLAVAQAQRAVRDYLDEIRRVDVPRVDGVRRDPGKVGALLRSLARNAATHAGAATLARDAGGADGPLTNDTVREYLDVLTRLMVVEDQPAWAPHLRSKYVLRSAPRRHFVDPSLAVAALRWAAFEIKLGAGHVDDGARSLQRFVRQIDLDRCGTPAVLGVIVATGFGYTREDGIQVIPIGALGP